MIFCFSSKYSSLSFKFPSCRSDFKALFDEWIKRLTEWTNPEKIQNWEKIFKFINKYSHLQVIEFWDDAETNQIWEWDNIIKDVLKIIEDNDKDHYNEMTNLCT